MGSTAPTPPPPPKRDRVTGWWFCPECGMCAQLNEYMPGIAWHEGRPICEVNGAGCPMVNVDPIVAGELRRMGEQAMEDDGTVLRVGGRALLRTVDHAGRTRWGAQWFSGGQWRGTKYRDSLWAVLWLLRKGGADARF